MPFKIAFLEYGHGDPWQIIDILADFVFLLDVFVNSFCAFYNDDGILITNNKRIFILYFKGWFFWDLIACFPVTLMENRSNKINNKVATNFN